MGICDISAIDYDWWWNSAIFMLLRTEMFSLNVESMWREPRASNSAAKFQVDIFISALERTLTTCRRTDAQTTHGKI